MSDLRVPDLNRVFIAGRLTRDPELKYTASNRPYCRFGIANTRYYRTKEGDRRDETTYVTISTWDRQAEWIGERLRKGRPVLIEGTLRSYEFDDKNTGQKVARLEVQAQRVTPLDWDEEGRGASRPPQEPAYEAQPPEPRLNDEPEPEDDIPF